MSGFTGNDGSALAGGFNPSGAVAGLNLDASGNLKTNTHIRASLLAGTSFSATTGSVTNAGNSVFAGFSVFNPANSGVSILVHRITFFDNTNNGSHILEAVTVDPALATAITPVNRKLGGPASGASVTFLNTGFATGGTTLDIFSSQDTGLRDFLLGEDGILLPKGSAHGIVFAPFFFATQTHFFGITVHWIEY